MIRFCENCGASLAKGDSGCTECGRAAAPARKKPRISTPVRSSTRARTRRAVASQRSASWIPWAVAGGLIVVVLVVWLATQDSGGTAEPDPGTTTSDALEALRIAREEHLEERVGEFQAAWNRSDAAAVGSFYAPRHAGRGRRLPQRFADRGWSDGLPELSEPAMRAHEDGEFARHADFWFDGGQVETVWKYEAEAWHVVQLILPKASELGAVAGSPRTASTDTAGWARPLMRFEIRDAAAVERLPGIDLLGAVLPMLDAELPGISDAGRELWSEIEWPVELELHRLDGELAAAMRSRNPGPFVLRRVLDGLGRAKGLEPPPPMLTRAAGTEFATVPFGPVTAFEGTAGGRHHLVIAPGFGRRASAELAAAISRPAPETPHWNRTAGGSLRASIDIDALLGFAPKADQAKVRAMMRMFAGDFSTVAMRGTTRGDHFELETFVDLGTGDGLVGSLLVEGEDPPLLLGWVPEDCEEFACVRFDIDAVVRLLGSLSMFGISMNPADWGDEFADLGPNAVTDLLDHLDGSIGFLSVMSTPEATVDPDVDEPGVFLLGSDSPADLREALFDHLRELSDPHIDLVPALGPRVWGIAQPGADYWGYVAETPDAVIVAFEDETSVELLREAVATEGRSRLPRAFHARVPSVPRDAFAVGLSSMLSDAAGRTAMRPSRAPSREAAQLIELAFERLRAAGGGVNAFVSTVEGEDGIATRVVY